MTSKKRVFYQKGEIKQLYCFYVTVEMVSLYQIVQLRAR